MLKTHQLHYFVLTVQLGSINKAAKALFISQPALTKQLHKLEEQINHQLLRRTVKGIELTSAGRYLYEQAVSVLDQLKRVESKLQSFGNDINPIVGSIPSVATYYLPYLFKNKAPFIKPQIVMQDITQMLIQSMIEGKMDLAVVQDFKGSPLLSSYLLFSESYYAVTPQDHPLAKYENLHIKDFIQYPILMWHDPSDLRQSLRLFARPYTINPNFIDVLWSESLIYQVLEGKGITFVPEIVAKHIQEPNLNITKIKPSTFQRKIEVVFLPEQEELVKQIFAEPNFFDTIPVTSQFLF
ncbi:DNA-binding transcriptional regulator, LysR family [Seinonella peptonophila]|uniref:DNA-binding transcriptional regulator, LysR family n=1 Tax=Seinonella peptonophila TaxID=112248 RepID=A0A1M5BDN4_9BACL|nr:LysR family transcriptional regulator [Seinonella peptonophila]SHF40447.1 DNA-binding transcriptional regulator, LysR family [Seinonella peptonophila]